MYFDQTKSVPVFGTGFMHQFASTDDIIRFAESEDQIWQVFSSAAVRFSSHIRAVAVDQGSFYKAMINTASIIGASGNDKSTISTHMGQLDNLLMQVGTGRKLTSQSPGAPEIIAAAKIDIEAASVALFLTHPDSTNIVGTTNSGVPLAPMLRSLMFIFRADANTEEVQLLRTSYRQTISEVEEKKRSIDGNESTRTEAWRETMATAKNSLATWDSECVERREAQNSEWSTKLRGVESEWEGIKRSLAEKVSLAAPTQYWKNRARFLTVTSVFFALTFSASIALSIYLFFKVGMPYLQSMIALEGGKFHVDLVLIGLPFFIPAFAGVWVLRILGRLFSTYAQLSEAARERKIMVETFLALSREDAEGSPLLQPEDRHLILKALFRPGGSGVGDDSPPVGALEQLFRQLSTGQAASK